MLKLLCDRRPPPDCSPCIATPSPKAMVTLFADGSRLRMFCETFIRCRECAASLLDGLVAENCRVLASASRTEDGKQGEWHMSKLNRTSRSPSLSFCRTVAGSHILLFETHLLQLFCLCVTQRRGSAGMDTQLLDVASSAGKELWRHAAELCYATA